MSELNQTQKPIKRIPYNKVTASVWEKQAADGRLFYTTTFSKSYKDKQTGEWKNSNSFTLAEMSEIPLLINQVSPHIQMLNERNKEINRAQAQQQTPMGYQMQEQPPQIPQAKTQQQTGLAAQRDAAMVNKTVPEKSNNVATPTQQHSPEQ